MKTNLLAQNDDLVIENLKADVGRSVMNLSHSVTFPIDVDGAILPICCIETLPSDSFEISVECLLRQISPLKVPLMTNLRLNTAFYYCDNRLAWKKWERFMTGGRSGNEVYDIPRVGNISRDKEGEPDKFDLVDLNTSESGTHTDQNYRTTLHTYFGISLNHTINQDPTYDTMTDYSDELPVAFPFFGYQIICRDYYTNVDRLPQNRSSISDRTSFDNLIGDWTYDNLFPSDDDEIRLIDGPQIKSGFVSGDDSSGWYGFYLDKVRYHDVRSDYFTLSKKAPMRGDAPTIDSVTSSMTLPSGTTITLKNDNGIITRSNPTSAQSDTSFSANDVFKIGNTIHKQKIYRGSEIGDTDDYNVIINDPDYVVGTTRNIQLDTSELTNISGSTVGNVSISGTSSIGLTAADIRLLGQLTVWQELNMLHDPYYNDFLNAHFDNVRVGESPVEKPQFIGGTSQVISINEILQTSQTTTGETGSPLGNQGATAMSLASNRVGTYYSNNYGYIIGVAYIIPDLLYKPAMPRGFSRRAKEDYYSPEFANLSMQATLNKEIFFSNDPDWNNLPWGYTGAYDELRSIPNRIAGDLLNPDYTDLQKWVLVREMANDNLPAMESTWISLKNNVDKTAWNVPTMPAFMLQCANYIKAVRPMPKIAIPKAL